MIFEFGDMFDTVGQHGDKHVLLVTTNSYIRKDGALVMGRGAARQAATRWPELPYELGKRIEHLSEYNVGSLRQRDIRDNATIGIGAFQVKFHFKSEADLDLIYRSTQELEKLALERLDWRFDLNYPGIGNGRIRIDLVEDIIRLLPDNVHVWRFE